MQLAIVTSGEADRTREVLRSSGIEKFFTTILGGDDAPRRKPYPDVALKAMDMLHVIPEETVLIGDSLTDILTGKNAGVRTGLYTSDKNTLYQRIPSDTKPDFKFAHYSELIAKLDELS